MTLSIKTIFYMKTFLALFVFAAILFPSSVSASISGGSASNLDQLIYRWRQDDGSESAATWRAVANTPITNISVTENDLRIRFNIDVPTNRTTVAIEPRLEFSDDTTDCADGTWADIGAQASGSIWRLKSSGNFTDGDNTTQQLSADTHVTGDIYDNTITGATINVEGNTESTEVAWAIEANSPANSTTYFFRVTDQGTAFASYSNCAELTTEALAAITLTQNNFLIYVDNDALDPTDIWGNPDIGGGSENSTLDALPFSNDPIDVNDEVRLRMNITVTSLALPASTEGFILQYAEASSCAAATGWTDVPAAAGGTIWEFADSTVTDNTALSGDPPTGGDLNLTESDRAGRYNKSDSTTTNPFEVLATPEDLEWDWHIEYVGNAEAHTYCFRMRTDAPGDLDGYNADSFPRVDTRPGTADQLRHGNFFTTGIERGFFWAD